MLGLLTAATTFMLGAGVVWLFGSHHRESVILEVVSHDGGMVCTTGEYLEVRVYADGHVEGDVFTGSCTSLLPRLFSSFSRRQAQLDPNQLNELAAALRQSDVSNVKESYPQFAIYTDSGTFKTIKFDYAGKEKRVALINPDPADSRNKANYPIALINV